MKDYSVYINAWHDRIAKKSIKLKKLRDKALKEADLLGQILINEFRVKEVYLFGSLVRDEERFTEESDIDIAVKGLPPALYFRALGRLQDASSFEVDLIPWESAYGEYREVIEKEGRLFSDGSFQGNTKDCPADF